MTTDELKQKVIDEILALSGANVIPPNAVCVYDLAQTGMSATLAQRKLLKLYKEGKLQRARGLAGAFYYWPVEDT